MGNGLGLGGDWGLQLGAEAEADERAADRTDRSDPKANDRKARSEFSALQNSTKNTPNFLLNFHDFSPKSFPQYFKIISI